MSSTAKRYPELMDAVRYAAAFGGLPALTLRDLAKAAGIPLGSLRHVFASKDALLLALASDVLNVAKNRHQQFLADSGIDTINLLPHSAPEVQQVRLQQLLRHHAQDPGLSKEVRDAFEAVARETRRLDGVISELLVQRLTGTNRDTVARVDVIELNALVEGLAAQSAARAVKLEEADAVVRLHLQRLRRR
jgi:AcrR family transcriptional regulator